MAPGHLARPAGPLAAGRALLFLVGFFVLLPLACQEAYHDYRAATALRDADPVTARVVRFGPDPADPSTAVVVVEHRVPGADGLVRTVVRTGRRSDLARRVGRARDLGGTTVQVRVDPGTMTVHVVGDRPLPWPWATPLVVCGWAVMMSGLTWAVAKVLS